MVSSKYYINILNVFNGKIVCCVVSNTVYNYDQSSYLLTVKNAVNVRRWRQEYKKAMFMLGNVMLINLNTFCHLNGHISSRNRCNKYF